MPTPLNVSYGDIEHGRRTQLFPSKHTTNATRVTLLNDLGVNWARLSSLNPLWREKPWVIFDALQIFALMWSLSQPWPWPRPWLIKTRWTVAVNLDVVSLHDAAMTSTGPGTFTSPWGELQGYMFLACLLTLFPIGLQMLWRFRERLAAWWLDRTTLNRRNVVSRREIKTATLPRRQLVFARITLERALLLAANLLYLPVVLAVVRLVVCDDDGTLSVDPTTSCRSSSLFLAAAFGIAVVVSFTVVLDKYTTRIANVVLTYGHRVDHERFLQRVEIEYALNLCDAWAVDHMWLVGSFRRHAIRYRVYMMYMKLTLVLVYAFGRHYIATQAVLFWGVLSFWSVWNYARPPYRCPSSNRLHVVLYATLWTNSFLGMMTGYGFRSPIVVAWTQFRCLAVINCVGVVAALAMVVAAPIGEVLERCRERTRRWCPAFYCLRHRTPTETEAPEDAKLTHGGDGSSESENEDGRRHRTDEVLAGSRPTLALLLCLARLPRRREWVDAVRRANELRLQCETCPKELEPRRALEAHMRCVWRLWADARAEESTLEPALGSALERLALVHAQVCRDAIGPGLTVELEETLLDPEVQEAIRRRRRAQILMTDRQRRIMLKLLAITAFLNHRDLRDMSETTLCRLRWETEQILSRPQASNTRAHIKTVCMQWKRLIQKSERDFERIHGYPPNPSDKSRNSEWYESYKKLRLARNALPEKTIVFSDDRTLPPRGASKGTGFFFDRDGLIATSTAAAATNDRLSILIHATEQVFLSGDQHPQGRDTNNNNNNTELVEAEACRKQWKRVIREWEADFEERNGTAPEAGDKQAIRSYYECYGSLRQFISGGRTSNHLEYV